MSKITPRTASTILGLHKQLTTLAQARQILTSFSQTQHTELRIGSIGSGDTATVKVPDVLIKDILHKVECELSRQLVDVNDQARTELGLVAAMVFAGGDDPSSAQRTRAH